MILYLEESATMMTLDEDRSRGRNELYSADELDPAEAV
jgi:hypothetical protein